jgi:Tfp pilus assembly protein PilF
MERKLRGGMLFLLFLVFISSSCSRPLLNREINFGIQAAQKNLWEEAVFRWKKAALSDPNSAAAHNNLAVAYEKKGLWEEAKKEYEIALKLSPKNIYIKANYDNFKKSQETPDKDKKDEKN